MLRRLVVGLFISLLALGCSANKPVVAEEIDENTPTIEAKAYKLVSFGRTRMAVPKKGKILLKDGEYAGNAGCNGMGGKYDIDLKKQTIKFHPGFSTMMACPEMKLETKFRKYLNAVDNYEIDKDMMMLKVGDTAVLNFRHQ